MAVETRTAGSRRLRRGRPLAIAVALVTALSPLSACGGGDSGEDGDVVSGIVADDPDGLNGSTLSEGWPLAPVELEDTGGERVEVDAAADKPLTLLFFGYTHCPDICLAVMSDIASALNRLETQEAEQVEVWFVTTDPARDDGATIRQWLDRFDPSFQGYTGGLGTITELADSVNVPLEKGKQLETGGYEVAHGTPVLGVAPGGEARVVWTEGTSAAKLAADVRAILDDPGLMSEA